MTLHVIGCNGTDVTLLNTGADVTLHVTGCDGANVTLVLMLDCMLLDAMVLISHCLLLNVMALMSHCMLLDAMALMSHCLILVLMLHCSFTRSDDADVALLVTGCDDLLFCFRTL